MIAARHGTPAYYLEFVHKLVLLPYCNSEGTKRDSSQAQNDKQKQLVCHPELAKGLRTDSELYETLIYKQTLFSLLSESIPLTSTIVPINNFTIFSSALKTNFLIEFHK